MLAPPTDPGVHERVTIPMLRKLIHVATAEYQYVIADTAPSLDERSITIMGDKDIPYRLLKKVMATCTASDYGQISLAVLQKSSEKLDQLAVSR